MYKAHFDVILFALIKQSVTLSAKQMVLTSNSLDDLYHIYLNCFILKERGGRGRKRGLAIRRTNRRDGKEIQDEGWR
jgi:hypothetical protein